MFYKMINAKRDKWYNSSDCTVNDLVNYIINISQMRDAQIEAIRTYLFLKIACENMPLYKLFMNGAFNSLNLNDLEISHSTHEYLESNPAAAALYEYVTLTNDAGDQVSSKVAKAIKTNPTNIDYDGIFKKAFYEVSYTDYLYSLPMGAGKTYLMAAFIYLDLYYAINEPDNKVFAHNFIIFAPSGLKTSVVPSLKTIQNFNPSWIIPEPAASEIKRMIKFEVLDQNKSQNKSNKTKNPNSQKINQHLSEPSLMGLVAVTNAEKVILDRIVEKNGQIDLFEESEEEKDKQANELRNLIGKLPNLAIYIDEVHHAATDDKKLRAVVNKWMSNNTLNSVVGFSGTPYLDKAEKIEIAENLALANIEISNIVYYYPLIKGIGNFLKRPMVKVSSNSNSLEIVEDGIRKFFDTYINTKYDDLISKLGIYCGTIEKLEEQIYPLASRIAEEYGLNSSDTILKFHRGNKEYTLPVDSQMEFDTLDKSISKIRIVLLVQIGKEGWDCRSLTGIILSQEGDCPTNMVLQTSCRCLRQVQKGTPETALIYLNESNADKLKVQLIQQHHITIKELEMANYSNTSELKRYNRMPYLKLPKIEFYQLKVKFRTLIIEDSIDTENAIKNAISEKATNTFLDREFDIMNLEYTNYDATLTEKGNKIATLYSWLYEISKESFGFVSMSQLLAYNDNIVEIFNKITYKKNGICYFSSKYRIDLINENIRKAFYEKRSFESTEELIPEKVSLLKIENFKELISTQKPGDYYPKAEIVENIILDDKGKFKVDQKIINYVESARQLGDTETVIKFESKLVSHPMKNNSFHYLPYKTDSSFEQKFLTDVLNLKTIKEMGLEVYYNGDRALTEFKIKCYKGGEGKWQYIGLYTPDFLIIKRKDGAIHRAMIVETKGMIYANDPLFISKRSFMETEFKAKNNQKYGYNRFEYFYLEDTLSDSGRIMAAYNAVEKFFKETYK